MSDDGRGDGDDESPDGDPFERFGPDAEREGDPFDRLDADVDRTARDGTSHDETARDRTSQDGAPQGGAEPLTEDPWSPPASDGDDATTEDGEGPANEPFDPESVRNGGAASEDAVDPFAHVETPAESPFDGAGNAFERVDSGGVDPDQVWAEITAEDDDGTAEPSLPDEGRYSEVSKHRFCEGCEHFSPPPDVACGHGTAEIIEFLDMDTVRLLDCPVVAEHEALERGE